MLLLLLLFVIKLVVIKKIRSKCMYEGVVQHADAYIYIYVEYVCIQNYICT